MDALFKNRFFRVCCIVLLFASVAVAALYWGSPEYGQVLTTIAIGLATAILLVASLVWAMSPKN